MVILNGLPSGFAPLKYSEKFFFSMYFMDLM